MRASPLNFTTSRPKCATSYSKSPKLTNSTSRLGNLFRSRKHSTARKLRALIPSRRSQTAIALSLVQLVHQGIFSPILSEQLLVVIPSKCPRRSDSSPCAIQPKKRCSSPPARALHRSEPWRPTIGDPTAETTHTPLRRAALMKISSTIATISPWPASIQASAFGPALSRAEPRLDWLASSTCSHLLEAIGDRRDLDAFICGSAMAIDDVRAILGEAGLDRNKSFSRNTGLSRPNQ